MIGALWTGISGLSSQQKALDNESNNIANVNTVGYKSSRISFADQMYQSKIGKGSIVQDAEKLFVQGNTKITGVEYDMMLEGDGFFTVINKNTLGTAESFYTRAGNFRMGENGMLQDASGNEVQGWIMSPIDANKDVTSTSPNTSVFTNDYNKMLGSRVIKHGTYVETITAKATDYNTTAKSDATSIFSGDGAKSKSSKVSDIETAIKDYNFWLQKLQEEPDAVSANSITQISQIDFKSGKDSIIGKDGDAIYVRINGDKISQQFLVTNSTAEFRKELYESLTPSERLAEGLKDPSTALSAEDIAAYDKAAGKIETYKALSDTISNRLAVEATMAIDAGETGVFNADTSYKESTYLKDMLKGIIQIKGLIPGQEFKITEVGEESGNRTALGNYQSTALAVRGSGKAALDASKEALSKILTGKQQDVFTPSDLGLDGSLKSLSYSITIYDKELGRNVPIPNDGANPPVARALSLTGTSVDDFKEQINSNSDLNQHIVARNVNGNLIIQTKDSNYDVEFNSNLVPSPGMGVKVDDFVTPAKYKFNLQINDKSETIEIDNPSSVEDLHSKVAARINTYNMSANEEDKVGITALVNGSFRIYPIDENAELGGTHSVSGENTPIIADIVTGTPNTVPYQATDLEETEISVPTPVLATGSVYRFDIMGIEISYGPTTASDDENSIASGLLSAINSEPALVGFVQASTSGGTITLEQKKIKDISNPEGMNISAGTGLNSNVQQAFDTGDEPVYEIETDFSAGTPPYSKSQFTLNLGGGDKLTVNSEANSGDLLSALVSALEKEPTLSDKYKIEAGTAGAIKVTRLISEEGTVDFTGTPSLSINKITNPSTANVSSFSSFSSIEANKDYSGREGAGAEFLEIKTTVNQTASQGSIQLRLDTLNISDSPFGEFSVDSTGLITMKQDGAEYAVGQVAIARFNNNRGLEPQGNNLFAKTSESGDPIYNINNNKMADVRGKALELSNADLSESLVNLMIFQRAFEANAKSITTSDELLNTLINLKR